MSSLDLSQFIKQGLFDDDHQHNIPKLNRKFYTSKKTGQSYCTVRYDKSNMTKDDYKTIGLLRSMVFDNKSKDVLAFSPQKSVDLKSEAFSTDWKNDTIQVEEFVDGTMINVFWDKRLGLNGDWQIASRSCVEANVGFYLHSGSKTFRTMFLEACSEVNLEFDYLKNKSCCGLPISYSFVLQHQDNRIVIPYKKPQLVLIAMYTIDQKEDSLNINRYHNDDIINCLKEKTTIKFPEIYNSNISLEDTQIYIDQYASKNTPYNIQGVVFNNITQNTRSKIRNPIYEEVRLLKGNQPKIQYRYLTLRQQNKVSDYLKIFPEDKSAFSIFRNQLHTFTKGLYQNYVNCYIKKQRPLKEFPYQFRTHMFNLHRQYLDTLLEDKKSINMSICIEYVNTLHPSKQMFAINYHMRKRSMDSVDTTIVASSN